MRGLAGLPGVAALASAICSRSSARSAAIPALRLVRDHIALSSSVTTPARSWRALAAKFFWVHHGLLSSVPSAVLRKGHASGSAAPGLGWSGDGWACGCFVQTTANVVAPAVKRPRLSVSGNCALVGRAWWVPGGSEGGAPRTAQGRTLIWVRPAAANRAGSWRPSTAGAAAAVPARSLSRVVGAENLCHLGRPAGKRLGSGPVPGGRWAGLHLAVRAMIFGLWA